MPRLCYNLIVISEAVVQQIKKYITDFRFIAAAIAVVYAACTHIFVLEGLPARVQKLEDWRSIVEERHHSTELALAEIKTSLGDIQTQLEFIRKWIINDRTQRL